MFFGKKKVETMEASHNKRLYGKMEYFPLWPRYIGEKEGEDFGQNLWD
jgi:hypothetical protein